MYLGRFLEQRFMGNVGLKCRVQSLRLTPPSPPSLVSFKYVRTSSHLDVYSYFEKGCRKTVHTTIPRGNMGYDQYAVPDT